MKAYHTIINVESFAHLTLFRKFFAKTLISGTYVPHFYKANSVFHLKILTIISPKPLLNLRQCHPRDVHPPKATHNPPPILSPQIRPTSHKGSPIRLSYLKPLREILTTISPKPSLKLRHRHHHGACLPRAI